MLNSPCFSASASARVKKGNQLYYRGKFDRALKEYNQAGLDLPDSALINFDIGAALYKKGEYKKAIEVFTKALVTQDSRLEAKASYNIGNSNYRMGRLKINTDLQEAINLYRQALDYYKRAIELDQKNMDAKYNHEFVERELKGLLDRLQKHKEQSGQTQSQAQNKKQMQGAKQPQGATGSSERSKQEQSSGQNQQQPSPATKAQSAEQRSAQAKAGKVGEGSQAQSAPEAAQAEKEMSEQEARMILERYGRREAPANIKGNNRTQRYYPEVLKDW
jgi:Ca-activated chloride channel family protein